MPDHSFSNEFFPNIQSEPPLTQLEVIACRPKFLNEFKVTGETMCMQFIITVCIKQKANNFKLDVFCSAQ